MTPDSSAAAGGYSEAEMIRMQRDAIKRVREMQQRASGFEHARRAAAGQIPAGEPLIPRPTLTGNPIGSGLGGVLSGSSPSPNATFGEEAFAVERPPVAQPAHAQNAGSATRAQGSGSSFTFPPPFVAPGAQSDRSAFSSQPHARYQGARQPAGAQRDAPSPGGLFSGLLGTNGIAGIGDNIGSIIGGLSQPVKSALDSLGLDNERLLIILVMFIVFTQDDYDNMLLLALGYLLF